MNEVLVIGITNRSEVISINENLSSDKNFNSHITDYNTGGDYTVAYNLAVLGVSTYFITRLGFDEFANSLMVKFDKANGMLYSNNHLLNTTPIKVYLKDKKETLTTFDNIPYDAHPSITDGLPSEYFVNKDYAIVNILNSNYLAAILHYFPAIHYVSNNNIPSDDLLPQIEGIILDSDHANTILSRETDYDLLANQLLAKGIQWLLITNKGKGVYVFTTSKKDYLSKEECGNKTLGTHEAFVSMFIACLANQMEFSESLSHALNLSNDMSFEEDIELKKEFFV